MLDSEKRTHSWACDMSRGDTQCPYVTPQGDDSILNCVWRIGHPDSLPHEAYYNQPNGPQDKDWFISREAIN